jgi:threonine aldolase
MLGGGMRQAGVLAAAGLVALSDLDRLHRDHDLARKLADGLAGIPGIAVEPDRVQTNMVYFRVSMAGMDNARLITAAAARGVQLAELGHGRIRSVTHCDVTYEDVDYALEVIRSALEGRSDRADRTRGEHADEGASIAG